MPKEGFCGELTQRSKYWHEQGDQLAIIVDANKKIRSRDLHDALAEISHYETFIDRYRRQTLLPLTKRITELIEYSYPPPKGSPENAICLSANM